MATMTHDTAVSRTTSGLVLVLLGLASASPTPSEARPSRGRGHRLATRVPVAQDLIGQERSGGEVLAFDDWRLDMVSHRLFHIDGEEVILSGADFALLKLFLDHPQEILDRDTIGNATRGRDLMPLDRIVDMAVSRLRQRLRDTEKPPRLIRTVRGSGYQLAANVVASNGH